jgi:hypothetical protein
MSVSSLTGPLLVTGNVNPLQNSEPDAGPSMFADGYGLPDGRFLSSVGGQPGGVRAIGISSGANLQTLDAFPQAKSTTNIVNAQGAAAVAGTALTLATATVAATVGNIPLVPFVQGLDVYGNKTFYPQGYLSSNVVTIPLTLDFGGILGTTFTSGTVTLSAGVGVAVGTTPNQYAGTVVNKNQIIQLQTSNHTQPELFVTPGTNIIVAAAGNAGGTIPLLATVLAVDYVQHYIYINVPALAAQTNAAIGTANQLGAQPGISAYPWNVIGSVAMLDPRQMSSRALQYVSANAGDTTATLTVRGYDVFGVPMTETITLNGTTPVLGKKAFKYIVSVTTGVATLVGNVSVGTTDTIGFPVRADSFSYVGVWVVDAGVSANTGFTKPDLTPVATATTGDVRGTYTAQSAPDGTKRVLFMQNPSPFQYDVESNLVQQPIFGQAQF